MFAFLTSSDGQDAYTEPGSWQIRVSLSTERVHGVMRMPRNPENNLAPVLITHTGGNTYAKGALWIPSLDESITNRLLRSPLHSHPLVWT